MKAWLKTLLPMLSLAGAASVHAQAAQVTDLPTRPGVTQRVLVLDAPDPSSVVVLISGGGGRLDIASNGYIRRDGNFLVRSRALFVQHGHAVVLPDLPSDRRTPPYLGGEFRDSAEHAADLGAIVAWARARYGKPVWLVGTSRGTHSAANAALRLRAPQAPDGIVLTATILARSRFGETTARPLTEVDLAGLALPVLAVHHEQDPCGVCPPALLPELMKKLPAAAMLRTYTGGLSQGDACEPFSHHGFNGIEDRVVADISAWIRSRR